MGKLAGKVALITGAARGQGRSHAVRLAREGADVVVCDIAKPIDTIGYRLGSAADLEETVRQVEATGRRCLASAADVRSQPDMDAVVERAIGELGRIDILIANAGIISYAPVAEMGEAMWQDMIDVNLTGVFHTFRAAVPHMPVTYKMLRPDLENPAREDVEPLFERHVPTPGLLEPDEVSAAVLFLVSDDGRHLSGETLTMSGGMSASTT